jgi:GNAT superfamily N-acetyltransferase
MASTAVPEVELRLVAAEDPVAAELLRRYAQELHDRFTAREPSRIETIASEYESPHGAFIVMYEGGLPIGCGGVRDLGDGVGEVKRMYIAQEARGRGHGARLLAGLEDEARRLGYRRLRLDTAASLTEAQALYRSRGYAEIPDYNGNTWATYWMEKRL